MEIIVSDTGGGIPQEIIPRLFEKFATRTVGDEQSHGTGLDLPSCKAIIEKHVVLLMLKLNLVKALHLL